MKIAICDDDVHVHARIDELIDSFFAADRTEHTNELLCFSDGMQLLCHVQKNGMPDIVFLDIEMSQSNGIDIAKKLRSIQNEVIIIFVSSHREYVFDAFRCEALHFLVKPIDSDDFDDCFARAVHKYNTVHCMLPLKWKFERANIAVSDVLYVEAYRGHIIVHTFDGVEDVVGKLKDIFAFLEPHGFMRIHHGYIVNMQHIRRFNSDNIQLVNGESVQMSVRKRADALSTYDRFLQKRKW